MSSPRITPGGVREMMLIALPMVVSYACDTFMMFTDRLLLSRLGPDFMNAAVGGSIAAFLLLSFAFGLIGYSTALVAQYFGAGELKTCPRVTAQTWIFIAAFYPVILLIRPFVHDLFRVLQVPVTQLEDQIVFFDILVYGSVFVLLRQSFCGFFSGIGRTGIVMFSSLTALIVNVIVSFVLIYGKLGFPALGIRGAAIGTITGSVSAVLVAAFFYFEKSNDARFDVRSAFTFSSQVIKKWLRYGYPAGIEMFLSLLAFNGLVMAFQSMGPVVATASSIVLNWDMVAYVPLMGMEIGVTSLVGRYIGAKQLDLAHRSTMSGLKVGCVYALGLLALFTFFPVPLAQLFHPAEASVAFAEAQPIAVAMLKMIAFYVLSVVIVIVFVGALRGAGDTLWAMSYHISLHWTCVAVLYVSTRYLGASAVQGWAWLIAIFLVLSSGAWLRYRSGKWKNIHVLE
ncbi:MAG TPA: MATE family efflux transporter [Candidatus Omnitrophota bacterium]|nr:MATE family efflux transporter [Candidatus Omnitrophota bacterium]